MRARDLGVPFDGAPGPLNAITDVGGVEVGYATLISGEGPLRVGSGPVRTGVTAVLPRGRGRVGDACTAGWYSLNGNGEMTGTTWIEESGALTLPILITNTHAIGPCHQGAIAWARDTHPGLARQWLLPVVAETWDGYLNDINGEHVTTADARYALQAARPGPVPEGAVGGGTGMTCYGFKGGTGTASRVVPFGADHHTVGALVQANFGSRRELTIAGVPLGPRLLGDNPEETSGWFAPPGAGSVIVIIATDAPLLPGQCKALARRVPLGLARTGTTGSHFSGDIFLAFSTDNAGSLSGTLAAADGPAYYDELRFVPWPLLDPFYAAVVQCVEEAVINAMVAAETMTGIENHKVIALPHERLREVLKKYNRLAQ